MSEEVEFTKEDIYCIEHFGYNDVKDYEDLKQLEDEKHLVVEELEYRLQKKENIIKEVREKVDNFDVFKEFTFPLMKRDEEQQVKSSIDYEWKKSIKEPILEILDKGE